LKFAIIKCSSQIQPIRALETDRHDQLENDRHDLFENDRPRDDLFENDRDDLFENFTTVQSFVVTRHNVTSVSKLNHHWMLKISNRQKNLLQPIKLSTRTMDIV
jgi:hypothetical protein